MKEKELEKILKALANSRRLSIIRLLKKRKEVAVGDIAKEIKLSFRATSRHIIILASADILEKEQRSVQVFYRISRNLPHVTFRILGVL